ncbi:MAG: DUF3761 domain-containing protein [Patescibacteria group bacterium]
MKKFLKVISGFALFLTLFIGSLSPALAQNSYYTNVNKTKVHVPVKAAKIPIGATGKCKDGSYTFALNHRGACSHHGGVLKWIK